MLRNKNLSKNAEYSALLAACLLAGGCATRPGPDARFAPAAGHSMTQGAAARLAALAERAIAEGRLAEGGNVYVSIVAAHPDDAQAWFRLGTVYLRTQQYAAAAAACERALLADPSMEKARANLALASLLRDVDHAVTPVRVDVAPVLLSPADARG